jgi:hypothetical protein
MLGASGCLSALMLGAAVEGGIGAQVEVAAGRSPVGVSGPEKNSIALTGIPAVGLRVYSPAQVFTATYGPRFFYRIPNPLDVDHPLLLHQVALGYDNELTSTLIWTTRGRFTAGEVDYTSTRLVFDPQAAALQQDVALIAHVDGESTLRSQITTRSAASLTVRGEYTTPLEDSDTAPLDPMMMLPDPTMPAAPGDGEILSSWSGLMRPEFRHVLTHTDTLVSSLTLIYQWFSNGARYFVITPQVGWEKRFTPRTTLLTSVGPLYAITLDAPPGGSEDNFFGGAGNFELNSILSRGEGDELSGRVGATFEWFFDPLAGSSAPRATAEVGLTQRWGRDWTFGPNASLSTVLRETGGATQDSVLRADAPVRYRMTRLADLEFGFRGSLRGASIASGNFSLNDEIEAWVYVGLRIAFTTGGEEAPWLAP